MQPSRSGPLQHLQLMAERKDLEVQRGTRAQDSPEHRQNRNQHGRHGEQSVPAPVGKFNGTNMYEVFRRYTRLYNVGRDDVNQFTRPGPHSARPGLRPVCSPSFSTSTPLTNTSRTPTA